MNTGSILEARARGEIYYKEVVNEDWDKVRGLSARPGYCTVGEIVKRYLDNAAMLELEYNTARNNVGALRAMLLDVEMPGKKFSCLQDRYSAADAISSSKLTENLVSAFKKIRETRKPAMKKHAFNSHLRQVRSIFSKPAMKQYAGLTIPNLRGFMDAEGWLKVGTGGGYDPISPKVLDAIDEAGEVLRTNQPDLHRVFMLSRKLGMRTNEILKARTIHIKQNDEGRWFIEIESRKSGRTMVKKRNMMLSPELIHLFQKDADEFLIAPFGLSETARHHLVYRSINEWLRQFLPAAERKKCLYELRKAAGSKIASTQSLLHAQFFLGHKSIKTTEDFYVGQEDEINALL